MKKLLLTLFCATVPLASAAPGDDLDFTVIAPQEKKAEEAKTPSVMPTDGEGCYVNDPRINNLANVLSTIESGEDIDPIKVKIGTYLEFSSTYIQKIGQKNVHIITEDCASYPTELGDLPFKIAMNFSEVYNRLISAIQDKDEIKTRFIARNVISRPIDLAGVMSLLTLNEIDKELAAEIRKYTSAKPVKDNSRPQDVERGKYKTYLIPLDLFRATGGKVTGNNLEIGLANFSLGAACSGMDSSAFYTKSQLSTGWLPGYRNRDEPVIRARSILKSYSIKVNEVGCRDYLKQAGRL